MGSGDVAMMEEMRRHHGLNVPVVTRLITYLWHLIRLDLGFSAIYGKPVVDVIIDRLPATLLLMASSLSFAFAAGMALGVLAARRVNGWPDTLISTLGLISTQRLRSGSD
jgi:peptide/nickel transport system permease protein